MRTLTCLQALAIRVLFCLVLLITSPAEVINDLNSHHLSIKISRNSYYNKTNFSRYDFCDSNWNQFFRFLNRNLNLPNIDNIQNPEHIDQTIINFENVINDGIVCNVSKLCHSLRGSITLRL